MECPSEDLLDVSRALRDMKLLIEEAKVCSVSGYCVDLVVRTSESSTRHGKVGNGDGGVVWLLLFEDQGTRYLSLPQGCYRPKGSTMVRRHQLEKLFDAGDKVRGSPVVVVVPSWEWHEHLLHPGARDKYLRDKLALP